MASPELHALVAGMRARPRPDNPTIEQIRAGFVALSKLYPPPPDARFEPVDAGGVPAEWVRIEGGEDKRVVLYFHGGGYCLGTAETHRDLVARLCRVSGARALSVDYRLAPEHPFPAALDDAVASYRWLRGQGVASQSIVVAGDSAGGGLSLGLLLALRDAGDALPAAAVVMSPVTDQAKEGASMRTKAALDPMVQAESSAANARRYIGSGDYKAPLVSPLYGDLRGLPPMYILVGTSEVLMDDSTRFAEKAKAASVDVEFEIWDEMIHIWPYFANLPEARQAVDKMGAYIKRKVAAA